MASHFSSIGVPVADEREYYELPQKLGPSATPLVTEQGTYWRWAAGCGAEIWLQANVENELVGMTPYFDGRSRIDVNVVDRVSRENDSALDGAFRAWAAPTDEGEITGAYPFVFDVPDSAGYEPLSLPRRSTASVAAFAHEIQIFPSAEAFAAAQTGSVPFSPQFFIPSGMFGPSMEAVTPPRSEALFAGQVLEHEEKTNAFTGSPYRWALVENVGGTYDVVFDPSLCDAPLAVGCVVQGMFWLCGRLHDDLD